MRYFIFILIISFGCSKGPEFDESPSIRFEKISIEQTVDTITTAKVDNVKVTVNFEDGDGDLGVDINDQSEPQNYFVTTLKKKNGSYTVLNLPLEFGGKFEKLAPIDYAGPINGLLDYIMIFTENDVIANPDLEKGDTLKFQIYIRDQAGNQSNTVETDPIKIIE